MARSYNKPPDAYGYYEIPRRMWPAGLNAFIEATRNFHVNDYSELVFIQVWVEAGRPKDPRELIKEVKNDKENS